MQDMEFASLNVMILKRKPGRPDQQRGAGRFRRFGNPDDVFAQSRPKSGLITQAEVRAIALAQLDVQPESVVWDIGAGSGAVAIEAAQLAHLGIVYAIEQDVVRALKAHGVGDVEIKTVFSPAWTTDWIGAEAREKLRSYGIAPPSPVDHSAPIAIGRRRAAIRCPYCGSMETTLQSEFGPTACKSIHVCNACRQPFEEFKPI
jgi:phenylacetate-CoA oxygenase PaaJ subunit